LLTSKFNEGCYEKNFLVLLMAIIVLLPFLAIAHTTYITGKSLKLEVGKSL